MKRNKTMKEEMKEKKTAKTGEHFAFMWSLTKGFRLKYSLFVILIVLSVALTVINVFVGKLLIDCIPDGSGVIDIFDNSKIGPLGVFIRDILSGGNTNFLIDNLWIFGVAIGTLSLITFILTFLRIYTRGTVGHALTKKMQMMLFTQIERIPYNSLKKFKNGDVIQTCTRDLQLVRRTVSMQFGITVWTLTSIVLSFSVLLTVSWQMALVSLASLPILFVYSFFFIKKVSNLSRIADDSEGLMLSKIEENLASVRTVKVYNNEKFELTDFDRYVDDHRKKFIRLRLFSGAYAASSDVFVIGQIAFATIMAGIFAFQGYINASTFLLVFSYVNMVVWPVREVAQIISNLAQTFASIDRMKIIIDEPIEDIDSGVTTPIKGKIVCKDLQYKYDDAIADSLHNINLTINPGETVALIGKTGSGKSTFIHLLSALFDYTGGSLTIDGVELRDYSKKYLRSNVACVLQDPYLFSKTVIANLKLVNANASDDEITKDLEIANLQKTISALPKGLETEIGEKGATLSGGQRQRLAIARSLLQNAPIMVFDDSLSALDTQTDFEIRQKLKEKNRDTTTIIITHRMQTARDADKIIVFSDGTIESIGSHDELMKIDGTYQRIYNIQTGMFKKELK